MYIICKYFASILALLVLASTGFAQTENFVLDNSHTSVIFGVKHFGCSYTYGRFNQVRGGFTLDRSNPAASQFQLAIDVNSIDSNDPKRDEHLKGPDFFNVKQSRTITFQSTSVSVEKTEKGEMYSIKGNLTIHGVTKEVTLPVKKVGEGNGPYGNYRCGFLCQTSIMRSEYGMKNMLGEDKISDEVAITVSFEGIRQKPANAKHHRAKAALVAQTDTREKMTNGR